ncbi:Tripeptidyl-peptidase sed3, partial [Lachnellula suecica]
MMLPFFILAFLLAGLVSSSSSRAHSPYAVKEVHYPPNKWSNLGPAPRDHVINLQIGLKQSRFDELVRRILEGEYLSNKHVLRLTIPVSDPDHSRYGQHLSISEVNDLVKPSDEALELVHDWLLEHHIDVSQLQYSSAKDWLSVSLPVHAVESLLDTQYSVFGHEDGDYLVRTPQWSIPQHLHEYINVIQPTNSFFRIKRQAGILKPVDHWNPVRPLSPTHQTRRNSPADVCNTSAVTPGCLRTLYGTINYIPKAAGTNKIGLNDFLGESNNRSDTRLFLERYRPGAVNASYEFEVVVIADGNDEQTQETPAELAAGKDMEGNLDVQTILGIAFPTPLTAYTTGGSPSFIPDLATPTDTNEPYLTWLNYILANSTLPQVISTSYADDEQSVPYSYAKSLCDGFAQLGARGITLFFGSGDSGVGRADTCYTNDGHNTPSFLAQFPSSCPYITAVGATKGIPEVVASDNNGFVSGGGFSKYFPMPDYQIPTVPNYITSLGNQFDGLYNKSGRGYPDIAAQGYRYLTIWNGTTRSLDGTSASTPTAAAIFALVNDALIAAGRPPMGWLNPWLYRGGWKVFRDV